MNLPDGQRPGEGGLGSWERNILPVPLVSAAMTRTAGLCPTGARPSPVPEASRAASQQEGIQAYKGPLGGAVSALNGKHKELQGKRAAEGLRAASKGRAGGGGGSPFHLSPIREAEPFLGNCQKVMKKDTDFPGERRATYELWGCQIPKQIPYTLVPMDASSGINL